MFPALSPKGPKNFFPAANASPAYFCAVANASWAFFWASEVPLPLDVPDENLVDWCGRDTFCGSLRARRDWARRSAGRTIFAGVENEEVDVTDDDAGEALENLAPGLAVPMHDHVRPDAP